MRGQSVKIQKSRKKSNEDDPSKLQKIKMALFTTKYHKIVMNFWSAPNALIFNLDVCFLLNDTLLTKNLCFRKDQDGPKIENPCSVNLEARNVLPATNWPPSVPTSPSQPCSLMPPVAWPRLVITSFTIRSVFHPIYFVFGFSHKDPQVHAGIVSRTSLTGRHCLS